MMGMVEGKKFSIAWDCKGNERLQSFLECPADEILFGGSA